MTDLHSEASSGSRSARLDKAIRDLLAQAPELEAAAVVSFDGLPMAAALPPSMDEDRVAAMSAALLSLGERAAEGLGRGQLSQVYIEGDDGTVFLVSADDEAVLVAVASKGAKAGMMLYEVRRAAGVVAAVLRAEDAYDLVVVSPVAALPEPVTIPEQTSGELPAVAPEPVATYAPAATWGQPVPVLPTAAQPAPAQPAYEVPAHTSTLHAVPELQLPQHDAPQYDAPQHEVPQYDAPQHEVPQHDAPQHAAHEVSQWDLPRYEVPQYEVPRYEVPQYEVPQYDVPQYDAPVSQPPLQASPQHVQPAHVAPVPSYATAPEAAWPLYAPTGSVMPGGGVPPSTWS